MNLRHFLLGTVLLPTVVTELEAQRTDVKVAVTASAVYVRAFGGEGEGVAVEALRMLPFSLLGTQHSFGLSAWYTKADIASGHPFGAQRTLGGVGVRWQAAIETLSGHVRPFLAVPVQLMFSSIPGMGAFPTSFESPTVPVADRGHQRTALSTGVGAGLKLNVTSGVGFRIGVERFYHRLFDGDRRSVFRADIGFTVVFVEGH